MNHRLLALAALCLLARAAAAAAPAPLTLDAAQVQALGLRTEAAQAVAAADTRYPGQVVLPPAQQQVVAAPVAALVTTLRVATGDTVRAGEVLATLRSTAARELQREVATADSQAQLAATALARDEALHREGLIPLSRLEATRAAAQQATLLRDERRRVLADVGAAGPSGEIVLRAPLHGVVLERLATVGQRLDTHAPLLRLGSLGRLWIEMQVPVRDMAGLHVGDAVRLPAADGAVAPGGRVIATGHAVDAATQTVLVRAEVTSQAGLRIGQSVEVLHARAAAGAVRVPASALVADGSQAQVFVQAGPGRFELARVEVLAQAQGRATLRGVAAGRAVVVAGVAALKSLLAAQPAAPQ